MEKGNGKRISNQRLLQECRDTFAWVGQRATEKNPIQPWELAGIVTILDRAIGRQEREKVKGNAEMGMGKGKSSKRRSGNGKG
jgi:hypothetical protein